VLGAIVGPVVVLFAFQTLAGGYEDTDAFAVMVVFAIYVLLLLAMFSLTLIRCFRLECLQGQTAASLLSVIIAAHVLGLGGLTFSHSPWMLTAYPVAAVVSFRLVAEHTH